ncbi:hypothetical protein SDC9_199928 [bioreactor metagenome]|uniref:Uncharacterized protein n=1 Tax=bioreactor metagenome TaxID=1076179 RepID=A0A645IN46_9ZZZZ
MQSELVQFHCNRFVRCEVGCLQEQAIAGSVRSHLDVVILECFTFHQRHIEAWMSTDREIHLVCIKVLHFVADRQLILE